MAGAGKVCTLVLLMALLALFAPTYADLSHPTLQSLNRELVSAFGVIRAYEPCCLCACTRMWPPERNKCACGGVWEGTCPSACKNCSCDENKQCHCQDGFTIKYSDCMSNGCPDDGASEGANEGM